MTTLDLINRSLRLIGVLASGESPEASEANDAFIALNSMINLYSTQSLMIYSRVFEQFSLVVNQTAYSMGVGGDFNTSRPQKIENINWIQTSGNTTVQIPIEIVTQDQWAAISVKTITSNLPTRMWPQYTFPNVTLNFWPIPSVAGYVVIWSWKPLAQIASLTTVIDLPPGYEEMLVTNLAVRIAPEYGKTPSEIVIANAIESKADVKRMNITPLIMGCDDGVLPKRSTWNWFTGE